MSILDEDIEVLENEKESKCLRNLLFHSLNYKSKDITYDFITTFCKRLTIDRLQIEDWIIFDCGFNPLIGCIIEKTDNYIDVKYTISEFIQHIRVFDLAFYKVTKKGEQYLINNFVK